MHSASSHLKDPSQNFIAPYNQPLDAIFKPQSIAVIGAKDNIGSVGRTILNNLLKGSFKGPIYPVNPKRKEVLGLPAFPNLRSIGKPVDLAVIVTPAATVPQLIQQCVEAGVKGVIVISAGFKELGPEGLALEKEMLANAAGKLPIIGPNCLGVMNPFHGLNATFAKDMALPGNIAFISQSGAMCTAVLDWSFQESIGFSAFVSIGSMADVDWGDIIDYLGRDPQTQSILIYMETIGNPRSFLSAAREIALEKPIILIKPGRSQEAAKAAASHTGSLAGSDDVFEAAMERVGVLRVNSIAELFNMASLLGRQPRPKGPHLSIVTNAGGPSVLATDAAMLQGVQMAVLDQESIDQLDQFLPPAWSHSNPVDLLGDASAETYEKAVEILAKDQKTEGILVILSPQDMTEATLTAEKLTRFNPLDKPLLTSWMGGEFVQEGREILNQAGIPCYEYPDEAAWSFAKMWQYSEELKDLYETPIWRPFHLQQKQQRIGTDKLFHALEQEQRTLLSEFESKQLLALYDIPVVMTKIASNEQKALELADEMGYPIVLKLHSLEITHKSDVGGVKLNLKNAEEVSQAFQEIQRQVQKIHPDIPFEGVSVQKMIKLDGYELILGSTVDPQFGPVILFGAGGIYVEIFKDKALALPPLNLSLARRLINKTKVSHALQGVRGKAPVDLEKLEELLVRFSQMIVDHPRIMECDINPLIASPEGLIALDARILLHPWDQAAETLPKIAIRPYPVHYEFVETLKNGQKITIRPIRPEDEAAMVQFHKALSDDTIRQRYFEFISLSDRIAHERLIRICFNDFDREIAFIAENAESQIVGLLRVMRVGDKSHGEVKLTIVDAYHSQGLGTLFMKILLEVARQEGMETLTATILNENTGMIALCEKAGFSITKDSHDPLYRAHFLISK